MKLIKSVKPQDIQFALLVSVIVFSEVIVEGLCLWVGV